MEIGFNHGLQSTLESKGLFKKTTLCYRILNKNLKINSKYKIQILIWHKITLEVGMPLKLNNQSLIVWNLWKNNRSVTLGCNIVSQFELLSFPD